MVAEYSNQIKPLITTCKDEFNKVKSAVFFKLVNYEENIQILKTIPHRRFLNLAIQYSYMIANDEIHGLKSCLVDNNLINTWGISEQKLHEIAMKNTEKLFPADIIDIDRVLLNLTVQKMNTINKIKLHDRFNLKHLCSTNSADNYKRYHISNIIGTYGAGVILYKNFLPGIIKKLKLQNYYLYILPSSVNEIVLLANKHKIAFSSLLEMISKMNTENKSNIEYLSNTIYYYNYKEDRISYLMD